MTMMSLGPLIASGRTSDVYAVGGDAVLKVLRPDVPQDWAAAEAALTAAVHPLGVAAPGVRGVHVIDGRQAIEFDRISGPSMWQVLLAEPDDVQALAETFATVHRQILRAGLPAGVPDVVARIRSKVDDAEQLDAEDRSEAERLISSLPRGAALLHGDFHPSNILMSDQGPVVIDWFDAAIGHPVADVVRSSLLIRPSITNVDVAHLPGATPNLLAHFHSAYMAAFVDLLRDARRDIRTWESVVAAARLAEGAESNESTLLGLWRDRDGSSTSDLVLAASGP